METLKLLLVTIGLLMVIVGFFFVAFRLLKKGDSSADDCSTENSNARAYGCGSCACGLPSDRSKN
jgi:hypothetical protein